MRLSLFALSRLLCYTALERFCRKCLALRAKRKGSMAMIKKRFIPFFLILMLLVPQALAAKSTPAPQYPESIVSHAGRSYAFVPASKGAWESSDEAVARVDQRGNISFLQAGEAVVTFTAKKDEKQTALRVTVLPGGSMPAEVEAGIAVALSEWQEYIEAGRSIPQSNKYTKWRCGRACEFGWCGAFVNYSLDMGKVPMEAREDSQLQTDGRAYAVREAAVPKIMEGFKKMDRWGYIPQPGYEVVYGRRGGYATMHVGLVTDVTPLGDGRYEIKTVEGNMGPRIRRYHYIYDAFADNFEKNVSELPQERQTDMETFTYVPHLDGAWYVTGFGQTWY